MSCKVVRIKNCEVEGTSFEGRTVTLNGGVAVLAKIVVRTSLNKYLQEVPGVIEDNIIHFSLKPLEGLSAGNYIIEYWVEIENIGREVVAVEEFKVVRAMDSSCNCESHTEITANLVLEKKEITVNISKNIINTSSDKVRRILIKEDIEVIKEYKEVEGMNFTLQAGKVYRLKMMLFSNNNKTLIQFGGFVSEDIGDRLFIGRTYSNSVVTIQPANSKAVGLMIPYGRNTFSFEEMFSPEETINVKTLFGFGEDVNNSMIIKKGSFLEIEEMA